MDDKYFLSVVFGGQSSKGRWGTERNMLHRSWCLHDSGRWNQVLRRCRQNDSRTGKGVTRDLLRAANHDSLESVARACTSARPERFCPLAKM